MIVQPIKVQTVVIFCKCLKLLHKNLDLEILTSNFAAVFVEAYKSLLGEPVNFAFVTEIRRSKDQNKVARF